MTDADTRATPRKPLTLPRSFSRVLGRLLALPPEESLPLAKTAWAQAATADQRLLAMRLRLRLLREAVEQPQRPPKPVRTRPAPPPPAPEPAPAPAPAPPKPGKLTAMDLDGGALGMMMAELGGSAGSDDEFFGDD